MLRSVKVLLAGALLALGSITMSTAQAATPTAAQSVCSAPEFNSSKHVYVAPELVSDPRYPENLDGLERDVAKVSAAHGLQVYVVACQGEYQVGSNPAPAFANDVAARWQNAPGFDKDKFLVITWIRLNSNPNKGAVAAVGGSFLMQRGFNAAKMGAADGPVLKDIRTYMPNNPKGEFTKVVSYINADIDHQIAMARLPYQIGGGIIALVLLIAALMRYFAYSRRRGAARAKLDNWRQLFDNANQAWLKLESAYLDFLQSQGTEWKKKFTGKTLAQYTAAVADFDELNIRMKFAKKRLDDADREFKKGSIVSLTGFDRVVALLTNEAITVTGNELAAENLTLFGSLTADKTFEPDALLADMEQLFQSCNTACASIMKAFDGANANKQVIETERASIEATKTTLLEKGLSFAPYQARYDAAIKAQGEFMAILAANPVEAYAQSESVKEATDKLEDDVRRALELQEALAPVQAEIAKATSKAEQMRSVAPGYKFPGADAPAAAAATFTLTEENGNPDTLAAKASQLLATAGAKLMAGELDASDKARAEASTTARDALAVIDRVVAAKAHVEKTVPAVREALGKLEAEIPAAETALASLREGFLDSTFKDQPGNVATAHTVKDNTEAKVAAVRQAYFEQRFLAASAAADSIGANIQGARDGLVEVHHTLATLTEKREHSRSVAAKAGALVQSVYQKLQKQSFTTAEATTLKYNAVAQPAANLTQSTAAAKADWAALAASADKLYATLKEVDGEIDAQAAAYEGARTSVQALNAAITSAYAYCKEGTTRQAASTAYSEAQTAHDDLQAQIQKAGSDWAGLKRRADTATSKAREAERLARADAAAAAEALSALQSAEQHINGVSGNDYGRGIGADTSDAARYYNDAASAYSRGDYESAKSKANTAYSEVDSAVREARAEVARRDEADAQAARDAAAAAAAIIIASQQSSRRDDNNGGGFGGGGWGGGGGNDNNTGGGWGGGGGNDGGGYDGGNAGGGTVDTGGNAGGGEY